MPPLTRKQVEADALRTEPEGRSPQTMVEIGDKDLKKLQHQTVTLSKENGALKSTVKKRDAQITKLNKAVENKDL